MIPYGSRFEKFQSRAFQNFFPIEKSPNNSFKRAVSNQRKKSKNRINEERNIGNGERNAERKEGRDDERNKGGMKERKKDRRKIYYINPMVSFQFLSIAFVFSTIQDV